MAPHARAARDRLAAARAPTPRSLLRYSLRPDGTLRYRERWRSDLSVRSTRSTTHTRRDKARTHFKYAGRPSQRLARAQLLVSDAPCACFLRSPQGKSRRSRKSSPICLASTSRPLSWCSLGTCCSRRCSPGRWPCSRCVAGSSSARAQSMGCGVMRAGGRALSVCKIGVCGGARHGQGMTRACVS